MHNNKLLAAVTHAEEKRRSLPCILARLKSFIRNTVGGERPFCKLLNTELQ